MTSPSIMDTLFQRTLEDLIKQSRLNLVPEPAIVSKSLEEIRKELKSTDLHTKSIALQKLCYLNSLYHVDMSWASFHCIECMSSSSFGIKRIGYVAASQSFNEDTPVLLLATNQLRKDMMSSNGFEASLALECFSMIASCDLARDLCNDVFTLLGSSKVLVRKKAIGVTVRLFEKYPDAVRVCFKRLVESLESSLEVSSATVGVFCELAMKDPRSYLPLAPEFCKVLVGSRNNWVLIKILKVFARLAPLEPRLAKRVVEPVCEVLRRTGAKSLVFECVRTVLGGLSEFESAVRLAMAKVREFLADDDPNLRYLGLHALSMAAEKHLWVVLENKEVVIKSLSSDDLNIKREALCLLMAMVSEDNIVEISRVLMNYALKSDPEFCNEILGSILSTCSRNLYEIVMDFDWYVSLLCEMSRISHCQKGEEIENQLIDIGMRVKDARPELVRVARSLLIDPALLGNFSLHRILSAAAWVSGEYIEFSRSPFELVEALVQPRTDMLPPSIRAVYLQSVFKILVFAVISYFMESETAASSSCTADLTPLRVVDSLMLTNLSDSSCLAAAEVPAVNELDHDLNSVEAGVENKVDTHGSESASVEKSSDKYEILINLLNLVESSLKALLGSLEVEVLERARNIVGLIKLVRNELPVKFIWKQNEEPDFLKLVELMNDAFSEELGPVSVNAQERVPIPDGLTLKENLKELDVVLGNIELPSSSSFSFGSSHHGERIDVTSSSSQINEDLEATNESTSLLSEHRRRHGLYYLPSEKNSNGANDYPPANDPTSEEAGNSGDADALIKLTSQSLISKKKLSNAKSRPVVVKLDETEVIPDARRKSESKDDCLSGTVREILSANDHVKGKEKVNTNRPEELKENQLDSSNSQHVKSSSRKGKHRTHHHKGKDSSTSGKFVVEKQEQGQKERSRSSHHGSRKSRQRADGPSDISAKTLVIPDFLL